MPKLYRSSAMFKRPTKRWPKKKKSDPRFPSSNRVGSGPGVLQVGDRISPPITTNKVCLRNAYGDSTLASTTSFVGQGYFFTLAFLDNVTTFLGLFDQYRIDYVEFTMRPQYKANPLTESPTIVPIIRSVVDYDDATAPTSMAGLSVFNSCETHTDEPFTRRFQPHTSAVSVTGTSGSGLINLKSPWIDCANPTVPHYGVKVGLSPGTASAQQVWYIEQYIWVTFQNIR